MAYTKLAVSSRMSFQGGGLSVLLHPKMSDKKGVWTVSSLTLFKPPIEPKIYFWTLDQHWLDTQTHGTAVTYG